MCSGELKGMYFTLGFVCGGAGAHSWGLNPEILLSLSYNPSPLFLFGDRVFLWCRGLPQTCDSSASVPQVAVITGMCHHAQLLWVFDTEVFIKPVYLARLNTCNLSYSEG